MFNEQEFNNYVKEFKKLGLKANQEEIKIILNYMYSLGSIVYESQNNGNN